MKKASFLVSGWVSLVTLLLDEGSEMALELQKCPQIQTWSWLSTASGLETLNESWPADG